jgi:hypothetical protein
MEQEKQRQHVNNIYLYCGKPCHVDHERLKKLGPHATCVVYATNPQLNESKNEHI